MRVRGVGLVELVVAACCAFCVVFVVCEPAFAAGPLAVVSESFSNVGSSSATLNAQVNSNESPSSFYFEYGSTVAYGSATPMESLGSGSESVGMLAQLSGLQPDSVYHFRVVATNASDETARGGDASFSTFPVGVLGLPDGRSYEMVSPANNGDVSAYEMRGGFGNTDGGQGNNTGLPSRAAVDGSAVAYLSTLTASGGGKLGNGGGQENLATRSTVGGWTVESVQPPGLGEPKYGAFTSDLSMGIVSSNEVLSAGAPGGGYGVLYSRRMSEGSYRPFFTNTPLNRPYYQFGAYDIYAPDPRSLVYAGASSDLTHLLFEANDALTTVSPPEALDGGEKANNLYDSIGGGLRLVNVLPNGSPYPNATFGSVSQGGGNGSGEQPDFSHVISGDGSRIFWTALEASKEENEQPVALYVRENGTSTMQVDTTQGPGSSGGGTFWTASSDGSRVFFTDEKQLTNGSTAAVGAPDLYEYNLESGHLSDLSVDANAGEHANVQGVLGASEDGSYVYFAAAGVLASGATPQACSTGECNLYGIHERESPRFIAKLSAGDMTRPSGGSPGTGDWQPDIGLRTAQVTPDGRHAAFRVFGQVSVYDFGSGSLSCASCNPTGGLSNAWFPLSWNNTYASRVISDNGSRVFFTDAEALVPQDTNGQPDVYEWERNGTGSCQRANGCVYLLSGGTSGDQSFFLDASANGNDAFIITRAQLVPQDQNEVFDVYDARVDVPAAISPPACTGTGCQGVPGAPPIFATPSSVTFNGVGNYSPPAKTVVKTKKPKKSKVKKRAKRSSRGRKHGGVAGVHGKAGQS